MPEDRQQTAIASANESAKERADSAINNNQTFRAPTTSQIEGRSTPVEVPTGEAEIPELPIYSFFQPSQSEQGRAEFVQQGQETVSGNLDDVYSQLANIGTQGQRTLEAEEEAGIPRLNTELVEIENELQAKSLQFRREREKIETKAGLTRTQRNAQLSAVARGQARELADLEVIRAARSNTLTNAQNLVNRKLELQFQDERTRLQGLQFIYEQNKDTLSQEKDRLFQQTLRREDKKFQVEYDKLKQFEQEKMRYVQNAAQAGADNNTLKTIQGAQSLDDLYSMEGVQQFALSPAEKLDIQAKRQSIYSSAVATRLALAQAGDASAIEELGFDPREIKEELDSTTKRQLTEQVEGSEDLLKLAKEYRSLVETYGYTNTILGNPKVLGKISSLRNQMTAAYKQAETLGTLDEGVLRLMEGILGEEPTSTLNPFTNITGRQSRQVVSAMDKLIETTEEKKARAQMRLGIDPLEEAMFSSEESDYIDSLYGEEDNMKSTTPANYYE